MTIALILSLISSVLTFFIVAGMQESGSGWPSGQEILGFILFWPNLIISLVCLIYSVSKLADKKKHKMAVIVMILSCIMPLYGGYEAINPKSKREEKKYLDWENKLAEWHSIGAKINPILRDYYNLYPTRFRFPYNDNEAVIDGFSDYAEKLGIKLKRGEVVDPWGDPVHFVVSHKGDEWLKARNQEWGIYGSEPLAVGLLLDNPNRLRSNSGEQWSMENGVLPKK